MFLSLQPQQEQHNQYGSGRYPHCVGMFCLEGNLRRINPLSKRFPVTQEMRRPKVESEKDPEKEETLS